MLSKNTPLCSHLDHLRGVVPVGGHHFMTNCQKTATALTNSHQFLLVFHVFWMRVLQYDPGQFYSAILSLLDLYPRDDRPSLPYPAPVISGNHVSPE